MAGGGSCWVAGRAGLWGALCYLGLGSAAPAPRFLGTQPPHATQVLNVHIMPNVHYAKFQKKFDSRTISKDESEV